MDGKTLHNLAPFLSSALLLIFPKKTSWKTFSAYYFPAASQLERAPRTLLEKVWSRAHSCLGVLGDNTHPCAADSPKLIFFLDQGCCIAGIR